MNAVMRYCALVALFALVATAGFAQQRRSSSPSLVKSLEKVIVDPVTTIGDVVTPTQEKKKKQAPRKYGVKVTQKDMEKPGWSPWFNGPAVSVKNLFVGVGQVPGKLVKGTLNVVTNGGSSKTSRR